MELSDIRKNIDNIDRQLLELFSQRMECSRQVAEYKVANGLPVLNEQREREVLDSIERGAKSNPALARLLFSTIMNLSKAAQYPSVTRESELRHTVRRAYQSQGSIKTVGCQGSVGSYSHKAACAEYPNAQILFYESFEQVFAACQNGELDCGFIPIENSFAGMVSENYDLLAKYRLYINGVIDYPVTHCLAGVGSDISAISTVYSHEQALAQCNEYITAHRFTARPMLNTAFAAEYVSTKGDPSLAAIASIDAAQAHGLNILDNNIQDSADNCTRFVIISNKMCIDEQCNLISVAFSLPHRSGELFNTLSKLAAAGVNMTKLESRPDKKSPFEYIFYVDFEGSLQDDAILSLLCGLQSELPYFQLLGHYRRHRLFIEK